MYAGMYQRMLLEFLINHFTYMIKYVQNTFMYVQRLCKNI